MYVRVSEIIMNINEIFCFILFDWATVAKRDIFELKPLPFQTESRSSSKPRYFKQTFIGSKSHTHRKFVLYLMTMWAFHSMRQSIFGICSHIRISSPIRAYSFEQQMCCSSVIRMKFFFRLSFRIKQIIIIIANEFHPIVYELVWIPQHQLDRIMS